MLRKAGYEGILTIEATSYRDFSEEAGSSLVYLRELDRQSANSFSDIANRLGPC